MKKSIIAFVLGFGLATAGSVYAEDVTATFSKFVFKVNGEEKKLEADPLVYQGSTYLPVRVVSNLLGYDVTYKGDSRTIELNDMEVSRVDSTTETPVTQEMSEEDKETINRSEIQIANLQQSTVEAEERINEYEKDKQVLNDKLTQSSDKYEQEFITGQIKGVDSMISAARDTVAMNQDGVTQLQAYIAKIKAKYEAQQ